MAMFPRKARASVTHLMTHLDSTRLPRHLAMIMDGNGRWARQRGLPRIAGHRQGAESVREVVTLCCELRIPILTLYAFSMENWKRPQEEVQFLMVLLTEYLHRELPTMQKNHIRFRALGFVEDLPPSVQESIQQVERETAHNAGMHLNLALNYGGRAEILRAIRHIIDEAQAGRMDPDRLEECHVADFLTTRGIPDPDLMIRTSGERRVSNFLLWQMAYTELLFVDTLWPDFRRRELLAALLDYQGRERRFGLTGDQLRKQTDAR